VGTGAPSVDVSKVKPVEQLLDSSPQVPADIIDLIKWAAGYYHHPLGEAWATALPVAMRKAEFSPPKEPVVYRPTEEGTSDCSALLKRAPSQAGLLDFLVQSPLPRSAAECRLHRKDNAHHYYAQLLYGVTGSGKTEVYIDAARPVIEAGKQVLILLPEIGLTPQLLSRIQSALACRVELSHSGLNDTERYLAWQAARSGEARILIGTRSAVFTPLPKLGLIVVDEEHDGSLKQQDGFRYHARDLAMVRARSANIPVVLASATPSLESLHNVVKGQLQMHKAYTENGVSGELLKSMGEVLARGEQVIVFINRRGFAPVLMCEACGAITDCNHCDAHMTIHARSRSLRCHHCGASRSMPRFSADFRSIEQMGQLIVQVAGRAGRAEKPGRVIVQSRSPEHPLLQTLLQQGYGSFTEQLLTERRDALWPPYMHIALLRSDSAVAGEAREFLQRVKDWLTNSLQERAEQITVMGPADAPMERLGGRHRAQLLLMAEQRKPLHQLLSVLRPALEKNPAARKVRWSIDVDPHDML